MMDEFFKGTIGVAVLIVVAGIVGASLSGSERAFDLSPFLTFGAAESETATTAPTTPSPTPSPPPLASGGQLRAASPDTPDTRLAICPAGSWSTEVMPLPPQRAQALQQAIANGKQFTDLIEIQASLGQPTCNFLRDERTRQYRYLVGTNGAIDALQVGDTPQVTVQFNGL
ncbi:MAG: hypothetical protein HC910_10960 [Spirulinaceae cyanobacterium SM2_1_0]|nr:hypothetical protein [Spirulinaceae cyanobacterium SM2_1_0]